MISHAVCSNIYLISVSVIFFSAGAVDRRSLVPGFGVAELELSFGVADTSGRFSSSPSGWDVAAGDGGPRAAAWRFDFTRSDILYVPSVQFLVLTCSCFLRDVAVGGLLARMERSLV